jgi:hypothetical protein
VLVEADIGAEDRDRRFACRPPCRHQLRSPLLFV